MLACEGSGGGKKLLTDTATAMLLRDD